MAAELRSSSVGRTMVLEIADPEHRNALGPDIYAAGVEALNAADGNPEVGSVVITGHGGVFSAGGNLQRLLKAAGQKVPLSKPILEINPHHPLVLRLKAETDDARFNDLAAVLFDQSLLAEGGQLEDPAGFVKRLNQLMLAIGG
jgi:enoyl-CoA hydratase/carnithine racemase